MKFDLILKFCYKLYAGVRLFGEMNSNKCNVGYGFVNMTSPEATWRLYKAFHLQHWEVFNSRKICEVTYARVQVLFLILVIFIKMH